jgi:hypothetical protein
MCIICKCHKAKERSEFFLASHSENASYVGQLLLETVLGLVSDLIDQLLRLYIPCFLKDLPFDPASTM